ncbi:hypothetical protein CEXT_752851 [Caerostris extrusa]|uniref:Thyroglobulin type-1 domain-containing protein n=1 Tax=Caerostris extrusa TaxID=172846 RepID=A0AAV4T8G6_CAEEX|nr:hypothetical protein CEXT_752851 [Caerostris extrusa]
MNMKNWKISLFCTLTLFVVILEIIADDTSNITSLESPANVTQSKCMKSNLMKSFHLFLMGYQPKCDDNGDLLPMQCVPDSSFCVCVNKKGSPINKPSSTLKGCKCLVKKNKKENSGMIGVHIPQCEDDGSFKKMQCFYSTGMCYCADPTTGKNKTEPTEMTSLVIEPSFLFEYLKFSANQ